MTTPLVSKLALCKECLLSLSPVILLQRVGKNQRPGRQSITKSGVIL